MKMLYENFDYSKVYEGKILKVEDNNECLVYIPMLFFDKEPSELQVQELINNDNIENNDIDKTTITSINGIYCKPFYGNGITRRMNVGEYVTVFFKNNDPQKPYFINGYFANKLEEQTGDSIYNNNDISIYTQFDPPKIVFKVKDNIVEITEDTIFGSGSGNGNGSGSGIGGGIGGTGTDDVITVVTKDMYIKDIIADGKLDPSEKKFIAKEFDKIDKELKLILELSERYMETEEFEKYKDKYTKSKEALFEYIKPMLSDMNVETEIPDTEKFYNLFQEYYSERNNILSKDVDLINENLKEAKEYIELVVSDNLIQPGDKKQLKAIIDNLSEEKPILSELAILFKVFPDQYTKAFLELFDFFLDTKKGILNNLDVTEKIEDKKGVIDLFMNSFITKLALIKAILRASQSDSESKLDFTKIGSANISLNSDFSKGIKRWYPLNDNFEILKNEIYGNELNMKCKSIFNDLSVAIFKGKLGDELTFSLYCKTKGKVKLRVYLTDEKKRKSYSGYNEIEMDYKDFERGHVTFKLIDDVKAKDITNPPKLFIEIIEGKEINFSQVKLEFGNVPTDWTPAKEDIEETLEDGKIEMTNKIESIKSEIKQTMDSIQMTVEGLQAENKEIIDNINGTHTTITEITQKMAEFLITLDKIQLGLEHNYGRIEKIESEVGNYNKTITTLREQMSQIKINIDSINLTVKDLQNTITEITEADKSYINEKFLEMEAKFNVTLEGIYGEVSRVEGQITEINKTVASTGEKLSLLESQIKKDKVEFEASLKGIILRLTKEEEATTQMRQEIADKVNNVDFSNLTTKVSGIETTIDDIKATVGSHSSQIQNVTQALDGKASNESVTQVNDKVTEVKQTLDGVSTTVNKHSESIQNLTTNLQDMHAPTKVTPLEKRQLKLQYDEIMEQKPVLLEQANVFKITLEKDNYNFALSDYHNFLYGNPDGILLDMDSITVFNRLDLENLLKKVYDTREKLTSKIAQVTKEQADKNASELSDMGSDSKITPVEKKELERIFNEITKEKESLVLQAGIFNLPTSQLENSYENLKNYLKGPGGILNNMSITSTIDKTVYNNYFNSYYDARTAISRNITNANKQNAENLIGAIQLGATNICKNSNFSTNDTTHWLFEGAGTKKNISPDVRFTNFLETDYELVKEKLTSEILTLDNDEQIMLSGWVKGSVEGETIKFYLIETNTGRKLSEEFVLALGNDWKHFSKALVNTKSISKEQTALLCIEKVTATTYFISNTQLEFGNIATAWKPSREDITDELSGVTNQLNQKVDNAVSKFEQTSQGIIGDISSIRGSITTITNQLGDKVSTSTFTALEEKVAAYKQTLDQNSAKLEATNKVVDSHTISLNNMENANKVTPAEKIGIQKDFGSIMEEKDRLVKQAEFYNIITEKDTYIATYGRLYDYIMVSPGILTDMSTVTDIDRVVYDKLIKDYYRDRDNLVAKITLTVNDLASQAKKDAFNNNALIADITADNKLTGDEKKTLKIEIDKIKKEYPKYQETAKLYPKETKTQLEAYNTAYTELIGFVDPLLNKVGTVDVDRNVMTSKMSNYYNTLTDLINKVNEASKLREDSLNSKLDNIKIGGTNLLKNTNFKSEQIKDWVLYGDNIDDFTLTHDKVNGRLNIKDKSHTKNSGNIGIISGTITTILEPNTDYCLSFKCFGQTTLDHLDFVGILNTDTNKITKLDVINIPTSFVDGDAGLVHDVFNVNERIINGKVIIGFIDLPILVGEHLKEFTIWNIKLEKGNKPTDWNESLDDIKTEVAKIDKNYSDLNQTVLGIKQTVGEQKQLIDDQGNRISQAETNIEQNSNSIKEVISNIENIEVGLNNIIPNSGRDLLKISDWQWDSTKSDCRLELYSPFGFTSVRFDIKQNQNDSYIKNINKFKVVSNYPYAFSCKLGGTVNLGNIDFFLIEYDEREVAIKQTPVRISINTLVNKTFKHKFTTNIKTKSVGIQFNVLNSKDSLISTLFINDLMLQQGPVFSPWTPAIEDMDVNLENITSMIDDVRKQAEKSQGILNDMMADGKLTADEKMRLAKEIGEINAEEAKYIALIDLYIDESGAKAVKTLYMNKRKELDDYMKPILAKMETSIINRIEMNAKFTDYYDARQGLVNKASEFAKNKADSAQQQANQNKSEIENTKNQIVEVNKTIEGVSTRVEGTETSIGKINISLGEVNARTFNNFTTSKNLKDWTNTSDVPAQNKLYLDVDTRGTIGRFDVRGEASSMSPFTLVTPDTSYKMSISVCKLVTEGVVTLKVFAYDVDKNPVGIGTITSTNTIDYSAKSKVFKTHQNGSKANEYIPSQVYIMNCNFDPELSNYPSNLNCDDVKPFILHPKTAYLRMELSYNGENVGGSIRKVNFYSPSLSSYDNEIDEVRSDVDLVDKRVDEFSNDGLLTVVEKKSLIALNKEIIAEKPGIINQAALYGISTSDYIGKYNELQNYLFNSQKSGILDNLTDTTAVDRNTMQQKFDNYFNSRQLILDTISSKHKDAAQKAQDAADLAKQHSNNVKVELDKFSSDSVLTPLEKREVLIRFKDIEKERVTIINQATIYKLSYTDYENSYNTLNNYLNGSPNGVLQNPDSNTNINRTVFNDNFTNYYNQRQVLLDLIAKAAKKNSDDILLEANKYTDGQLNITVESFNSQFSEVKQTQNQISQQVSGISGSITKIEGNLSDTNSKIDNLTIGSTNLIKNSAFIYDKDQWSCSPIIESNFEVVPCDFGIFNKCLHSIGTDSNTFIQQDIDIERTETPKDYVLSFFAKIVSGECGVQIQLMDLKGQPQTDTTWISCYGTNTNDKYVKFTKNFKVSKFSRIRIQIGRGGDPTGSATTEELYITGLKLEEGSKSSSWSPSSWDTSKEISNAASQSLNSAKDYANQKAQEAKDAAANAQASADSANGKLQDMTSDNVVTAIEKKSIKSMLLDIEQEYPNIVNEAQIYNVSSTDLTAKYNSLVTYLTNTQTGILRDMNIDTNIVRSEFNSYFNNYFSARQQVLNTIADNVKSYADNIKTEANSYTDGKISVVNKTITETTAGINNRLDAVDIFVRGQEQTNTQIQTSIGTLDKNLSDKINNIKVGANNLILNSGNFRSSKYWTENGNTSSPGTTVQVTEDGNNLVLSRLKGCFQYDGTIELKPNTTYIYSMEIKVTDGIINGLNHPSVITNYWCWDGENNSNPTIFIASQERIEKPESNSTVEGEYFILATRIKTKASTGGKKIKFKPIIWDSEARDVRFWLKNIQLEEGNVRTAWRPNPMDEVERIQELQIGFDNMLDNSGAFQDTRHWRYNTNLSITNKSIEIGTDNIGSEVKSILNFNIHGFPANFDSSKQWFIIENDSISDRKFKVGRYYTFVGWMKSSIDFHFKIQIANSGGNNVVTGSLSETRLTANTWRKVDYVAFVPISTGDKPIFRITPNRPVELNGKNFTLSFADFKLEEGTVPTPWTASQDDIKYYADKKTEIATQKAESAKQQAQEVQSNLNGLSADNMLTAIEKKSVNNIANDIKKEYPGIINQSRTFIDIDNSRYTAKYNELINYLYGNSGVLTVLNTNSEINRTYFNTKFNEYYEARQSLLDAIVNATKTNATEEANKALDSAKKYADEKVQEAANAAANAQAAAQSAKDAADKANGVINGIIADNVISSIEKKSTNTLMQDIIKERDTNISNATKYNIPTTEYVDAYNTLYNYMYGTNGLLKNLNTNSDIDRNVFTNNFNNYFTKRQLLLNSIESSAKKALDDAKKEAKEYTDGQVNIVKETIRNVESGINTRLNSIDIFVSSQEQTNTQIQSSINQNKQEIQSTNGKVEQVQQTVNQTQNNLTQTNNKLDQTINKFDNLKTGGINYIRNGNFTGATIGSTSIKHWILDQSKIFEDGSSNYLGDGRISILHKNDLNLSSSIYGIASEINPSKIFSPGEEVSLSLGLNIEENVKDEVSVSVQYFKDGILSTTTTLWRNSNEIRNSKGYGLDGNKRMHKTFRIPDNVWELNQMRVKIIHPGRKNAEWNGSYLVQIANITLNKSNTLNQFTENPLDIEERENEKINSIEFTGRNLIRKRVLDFNLNATANLDNYLSGSIICKYSLRYQGIKIILNNIPLNENTEYTLSYKVKKISGGPLNYIGGHKENVNSVKFTVDGIDRGDYTGLDDNNRMNFLNDGNYHEIIFSFKITEGTATQCIWIQTHRFDGSDRKEEVTVEIKDLKLEEGSKRTFWIASPEDINDKNNELNNSITETKNDLNQMASDNNLSAIEKKSLQSTIDSIKKEHPGYISQAQSYYISSSDYDLAYNNLISYTNPLLENTNVSSSIDRNIYRGKFDAYYESRKNLLKTITETEKLYVDNIEIGGTNLIKYTRFFKDDEYKKWDKGGDRENLVFNIRDSEEVKKFTGRNESCLLMNYMGNGQEGTIGRYAEKELISDGIFGKKFTLSADLFVEENVNDPEMWILAYNENGVLVESHNLVVSEKTTWVRKVLTVTISNKESHSIYARFDHNGKKGQGSDSIWLTAIKLEKGNKNTSWSRCPLETEEMVNKSNKDLEAFKEMDKWIVIDNRKDIYIPFDDNAMITNGDTPKGNSDLVVNEGKFGNALSTHEAYKNIFVDKSLSFTYGYKIPIKKIEKNNVYYEFNNLNIEQNALCYYGLAFNSKTSENINNYLIIPGEYYTISADVYVSEDFKTTGTRPGVSILIEGATQVKQKRNYDITKLGTWQRLYYTVKINEDYVHGTSSLTFLIYPKNGNKGTLKASKIIYKNPQVVKGVCRLFSTNYNLVEQPKSEALYQNNIVLEDSYTMMSYRRHITSDNDTLDHHALIFNKNNDNYDIKYYENGTLTEKYKDKWLLTWCYSFSHFVNGNGNVSADKFKDISNLNQPISTELKESPSVLYSFNDTKRNQYLRQFIFAKNEYTVSFSAIRFDNYGAIYINGEKIAEGDYDSKDISLTVRKGWNLIEIILTDTDTGGALIIPADFKTKLYSNPNMIYATAVLPLDFYQDKININFATFSIIDESAILNGKILNKDDINLYISSNKRLTDPTPIININNPYDVTFNFI